MDCKQVLKLMHYSVPKLKKIAKSHGFIGYSRMTKNELLQLLGSIKLKKKFL